MPAYHAHKLIEVGLALSHSASKHVHTKALGIQKGRRALEVHSSHGGLQFSKENLNKQLTMFKTNWNTDVWEILINMFMAGGMGICAKDTILYVYIFVCTVFLSAVCGIWAYSRYYPQDELIQFWNGDFEKIWGFRITVVAD
ncbi:hypothetical protein OBBRIDRAFT_802148 [Obba rivulosa]|uniref:Uncharacterized protein n=1 Tax=Obba rivulosa TaxID=1052685 RepID=A0A8E2AZE4_9APHY|nr:hypothetical protein OBBRIDRAFT_802148 [Obba rivulosa]